MPAGRPRGRCRASWRRVVVRNADPAAPLPAGSHLGFGHPFAAGDLPASRHPELRLADGTPVPLQQCDNEARSHPDGSLAFATFALALPAALRRGGALRLAVCAADGPKAQAPSGLDPGPLQARGYRLQLATGGVTYTAALAEALAAPAARVLADGPVCKEWRGLAPFRDPQGAPHPDLWCRFYARLHRDGTTLRLAAQALNGWTGDGRSHDLDGAALLGPGGPLPGFAWGPFRHTYHSAWFAFDADALPYWSAGRPAFSVGLDPAYAARALAVWDYMPGLADAIGTPARQDYSKAKPRGYDPAYVPGDPAGYSLWVAAYGDDVDRGELGPLPSWSVAHLLKGTPDWARYDRVHALALATAPVVTTPLAARCRS